MDSTQQKALNALEPFILLSKSATSPRAAADLVKQATSATNTFVFAELLQIRNIQNLATGPPEYATSLKLLQIFAWGTWGDYQSQSSNLPELSESQETKLRQLTLLTLASHPQNLTYAHLLSALSLPSIVALESLVTSSIYAGLLTGQLNPLYERLDVTSVAPLRDLRPGCIPTLVGILERWDERCTGVLEELHGQVVGLKKAALERKRREDGIEQQRIRLMDEGKGGLSGKRAVEMGDEAELGDAIGGMKRTRATKGGAHLFGGLGKRLGGGG